MSKELVTHHVAVSEKLPQSNTEEGPAIAIEWTGVLQLRQVSGHGFDNIPKAGKKQ